MCFKGGLDSHSAVVDRVEECQCKFAVYAIRYSKGEFYTYQASRLAAFLKYSSPVEDIHSFGRCCEFSLIKLSLLRGVPKCFISLKS